MDVRQDELGDMVDKEMATTAAAIEEAVRRIDVRPLTFVPPLEEVTSHVATLLIWVHATNVNIFFDRN